MFPYVLWELYILRKLSFWSSFDTEVELFLLQIIMIHLFNCVRQHETRPGEINATEKQLIERV